MKAFLSRYGVMFAFLALALAGAYAMNLGDNNADNNLYHSQLAQCEKLNDLKNESNQRVKAHVLEQNALGAFLVSAAEAREASGTKIDKRTAATYRKLSKDVRSITFDLLPLENCNETVPKP